MRCKIWFNQIIVSCASAPNGNIFPVLRPATSSGIFLIFHVTKIFTPLAEVPVPAILPIYNQKEENT
jgi:hypothetical protein